MNLQDPTFPLAANIMNIGHRLQKPAMHEVSQPRQVSALFIHAHSLLWLLVFSASA